MKTEFPLSMVCGVIRLQHRLQFSLSLVLIVLAFSLAPALAAEPNAPASIAHLDVIIDRLASPKFFDREVATKELLQRGSAVIPKLEATLPDAKGETRYRIRMILDRQRASSDATIRRAAEKALARIAASKDKISAAWAQSLLHAPTKVVTPVMLESAPNS